jgi:hypothetical protein
MASLRTFGEIIEAAQQRADMVGSDFLSDSEWRANTNASLQDLYDRLIEAYGNDYYVQTPYSFTTDGTNEMYALPDDFYKLLGVDLQVFTASSAAQNGWVTIWRFDFAERNQYTLPGLVTLFGRTLVRYRLSANNIWLSPLPQSGQVLRLRYAPTFTLLVDDSDTFDGVNGWEEYAINLTAKKALVKEESDTSGVDSLMARDIERLETIKENRDAGAPSTTIDVYRINGGWFGYDGGWCP